MDESLRQSEDGSAVLVWDSETEEGMPQGLSGTDSAIHTALPVKREAVPETLCLEIDEPSQRNETEPPSELPKKESGLITQGAFEITKIKDDKDSVNCLQAKKHSPRCPEKLQTQENMHNLPDLLENKSIEKNVCRNSCDPRDKDSSRSPVRLLKRSQVQITQESVSPADSIPSPSLLEVRKTLNCPLNIPSTSYNACKGSNADAASCVSVDFTVSESKKNDIDRSQSLLKSLPSPLPNTHALPRERGLPKLSLAKKASSTWESPKSRMEGSSANIKSLPNRKRKKQTKLSDR